MKIIKISALWCPSCIIMNKIYHELSQEYGIELINYDYDFDEELVSQYEVGKTLPVAIVLNDNNQEAFRLIGENSKQEIITKLKDIIKEV